MWLWVSLLSLGRMFTRHVTTFLSVFTLFHWEQIELSVRAGFCPNGVDTLVYLLLHVNGFTMIKYASFKPIKMINGNTSWNGAFIIYRILIIFTSIWNISLKSVAKQVGEDHVRILDRRQPLHPKTRNKNSDNLWSGY